MTSDVLAQCAAETVAIVDAGSYVVPATGARVVLTPLIERAVSSTRVLDEAALTALIDAAPRGRPAVVGCLGERSGAAAKRLLDEGAKKVAVLNYANGVRPGGGFLHGARAQEEALCRCSALYRCLIDTRARPFFDDNLRAQTALVTGAIVVSDDVPFFRDEDLSLRTAPFCATVLTAAAPDLGWLLAATSEGIEPKSRFDEVPAVFARRTRFVVAAAVAAGCDALVAGPWGCGAFGNDADVVADAFAAAIDELGAGLSRVAFSVWGPEDNRAAFEGRFAPDAVRVVRR